MEEKIAIAWMGEYYHRIEQLPSMKECLDEAMGRTKEVTINEMSDEAMLEMVKSLNARFGGTVEGEETE